MSNKYLNRLLFLIIKFGRLPKMGCVSTKSQKPLTNISTKAKKYISEPLPTSERKSQRGSFLALDSPKFNPLFQRRKTRTMSTIENEGERVSV